jgi:Divergent InlB B-repeat domain
MPSKRLAATVAGALVTLGFVPASAPSQSVDGEVVIELATAGPGTVTISPAQDDEAASCKTNAQQPDPDLAACRHVFESATRVTLEAVPDTRRTFAGWSDFACRNASTRCTLNLRPGTRYVSAQFSPVTLRLFVNESPPDPNDARPYGVITVRPRSTKPCSLNDGDPCEYPRGTTITLTREHAAPGYFWVGACQGNRGGLLDASECRLRLTSDEAVGAGYDNVASIPPPLGSGIAVVVAGGGKVTGTVLNGTQTLNCGTRCVISGLTRYDYVRLTAKDVPGRRFSRWSNLSREKTQIVPMSSTNRIQAVFVKR